MQNSDQTTATARPVIRTQLSTADTNRMMRSSEDGVFIPLEALRRLSNDQMNQLRAMFGLDASQFSLASEVK